MDSCKIEINKEDVIKNSLTYEITGTSIVNIAANGANQLYNETQLPFTLELEINDEPFLAFINIDSYDMDEITVNIYWNGELVKTKTDTGSFITYYLCE